MVRYGRGRVRLLRKHPETFRVLGFVPALFLAGLLFGPLACLAWPLLWLVYVGTLLMYGKLVLVEGLRGGVRGRSLPAGVLLPVVFSTIHAGAGTGILLELLRGRRSQ
jgi:hypothetical protein